MLDDWRINFEFRDLPPEAWAFIRTHRFFGLIIPTSYGGLGFSAQAHSAIVSKISTRSIAQATIARSDISAGGRMDCLWLDRDVLALRGPGRRPGEIFLRRYANPIGAGTRARSGWAITPWRRRRCQLRERGKAACRRSCRSARTACRALAWTAPRAGNHPRRAQSFCRAPRRQS